MFKRILIIIFIILLLSTCGEIGYYLYIQNYLSPTSNKEATPTKQPNIETIITPKPTSPYNNGISYDDNLKVLLNKLSVQRVVTILNQVEIANKKTTLSSILTTQYEGKITGIKSNKLLPQGKKMPVEFQIDFNSTNDPKEDISALYYKNDIPMIHTFELKSGKKAEISSDLLKVGDKINLTETFDIKNDKLLNAEIIRQ